MQFNTKMVIHKLSQHTFLYGNLCISTGEYYTFVYGSSLLVFDTVREKT